MVWWQVKILLLRKHMQKDYLAITSQCPLAYRLHYLKNFSQQSFQPHITFPDGKGLPYSVAEKWFKEKAYFFPWWANKGWVEKRLQAAHRGSLLLPHLFSVHSCLSSFSPQPRPSTPKHSNPHPQAWFQFTEETFFKSGWIHISSSIPGA